MSKRYVYHRALNTEEAFREFVAKESASSFTLAAEGDVCWAYIDGEYVIYIHHPDVQGKALSNATIKELLAKDELFTLEKLFSINSDVHFVLELKTGNGDLRGFMESFRAILEKYDVQNAIVDAFSVEQLRTLKEVFPSIETSLHTKLVLGEYLLETTFEKPYVRVHNLYKLDFIDIITLSFGSTHTNYLSLDIDKTYKHIYKSGKKLNLGAIKTLKNLKRAKESRVEYIYLRSKEVVQSYSSDEI